MARVQSLADVFNPKSNSLNALRLIFAVAVLVSHSFAISGSNEPRIGTVTPAQLSVDGFFVVSGYLITMSRLRSATLRSYAWRRFLRIYPGLWVNLVVTVAVIVPLLLMLESDKTTVGAIARYVGVNAVLPRVDAIDGALSQAPYAGVINGSLWTLQWELAGYVALGVLGTLGLLARRLVILPALMVFTGLSVIQSFADVPVLEGWYAINGVRFGLLFLAGAAVFLCQGQIPGGVAAAAVASVLLVTALLTLPNYRFLGAVPLAYLCIWLGARLPLSRLWTRANRQQADDISYGVYVYAFPVQQLVWALVGSGAHPLTFMILSVAITFPLAFASWRLVEAPAMAWGLGLRRRTVTQQEPAV